MEYTLETVNIKDEKTDKRGKKYHSVGIRIAGEWHNNIIYNKDDLLLLKEGTKLELTLFKEEGTGDYVGKTFNKFKLPSETDKIKSRLDRVEQALKKIYDSPKIVELLNL